MAFAFLFPGQGSQSLNMMDGFAAPIVKETFDEASEALGEDLWAMLKADSAEAINQTINTQPLMLAAGVATYRAWLAAGGATPTHFAGHSLGEYSALVAADALDFDDAVRLVRLRAEAMQSAVPAGEGAMAAVLGLDDAEIVLACAEAAAGDVVSAVNFNAPGQVGVAGSKAAGGRAIAACKARGAKRAMPLPVSVPSHCALMRPAADKLAEALVGISVNVPLVPVVHNADGASYTDPAAIRDALVRQLYSPVRWTETIRLLAAQGVLHQAECGPGKVLAGLNKRIEASVVSFALTNDAALETTLDTLAALN